VERPPTRVLRDPVHHHFPHRIDEHGIPQRGRRALAHAEEVTVQVHGMRHRGHVLQPEAYPLASPHPDRLRSRIGLPIDCPDILTHPATEHDRPLDIGNELRPRRARPTAQPVHELPRQFPRSRHPRRHLAARSLVAQYRLRCTIRPFGPGHERPDARIVQADEEIVPLTHPDPQSVPFERLDRLSIGLHDGEAMSSKRDAEDGR